MAVRSKVPKFGEWENQDDVPYTVYFEKAKKGRKSTMNPQIFYPSSNNEHSVQVPEEAQIRYGELTKPEQQSPKVQDSSRTKHETRVSHEEVDFKKSNDSSSQPRRNPRVSGGSVQNIDNSPMHPRRVGDSVQSFNNSPVHPPRVGGSVQSFENSPVHPRRNRGSVSSESSYGAGSSTPGRTRLGQVSRGDENTDDGPAIPKFGGWDDSDPTSGEGYTEVFNKARQDKHAGGKSPMVTSENVNFYGQPNKTSKGCGCFPWSRK